MNLFPIFVLIVHSCVGVENWQPILESDVFSKSPVSYSSLIAQRYQPVPGDGNQCELYKVGFTQDLYFQYVQYKTHVPEMSEFTLCYWSKFTNHSTDHPMFSYAVDNQPRSIYSWVSNTERSSYFSLAVEGHTFYRLNYPLRLNRWYHTCQSWNGKTGEWQIWVNAERVGRGFHNRLVGHNIQPGGIAITGQEQTQFGGGFLEGKGTGGMLGEITMVQLYSVALTAGKAHKDHKHHHAHEYDHNGRLLTTTPAPPPMPRPTQPTHPLLTAGQINPGVALNIAAQQAQLLPGQSYDPQFLGSQFSSNLVPQQLIPSAAQFQIPGVQQGPQTFRPPTPAPLLPQPQPQQQQVRFLPPLATQANIPQQLSFSPAPLINSGLVHPSLVNPANVQIIDTKFETHQLFKRHDEKTASNLGQDRSVKSSGKDSPKRNVERRQQKRELILSNGHILDDSLLEDSFDQSLLAGLAGIGQNEPILQKQRQLEEREPAEAEVGAVLNVCSSCDEEPFAKALVFGWRTVPKKLYSGAFYTQAVPECKAF